MTQIIQSPNLVFGLMIHPDSKLLHYLFMCTANSYCTILLYFILRSALFDTLFCLYVQLIADLIRHASIGVDTSILYA